MIVYADLLMLINFLVDFLLLYGTNRLTGYPGNAGRAALGAGLGAIYAGACCLPGFSFLASGLWRLVSLVGMSLLAFGCGRYVWRRGMVFFLLSMALGGLAAGFDGSAIWTLLLSGAALWLLCRLGFGGRENGERYLPIRVTHGGKSVQLTALADTGNGLHDPVSGSQVLVADAQAAACLLGLTREQLESPLQTLSSGRYPGLRLIPYHAIGQPAGMLLAIRPDSVLCCGKPASMLVAFAPQRIGENKAFDALAGGVV